MNFQAIIEPQRGSDAVKLVIDFTATDFDAACHFVNVTMAQLGLKGMSTVIRTDGDEDKTGMSGSRRARTSYTGGGGAWHEQERKPRKCFDCDDPATECHMNCGPASDPH